MWSCVREFVRGTRKVSISGCYRVWIHWVQSNTRVISCERTLTSVEVSFTITASAAHTIPSDARSSVPPPPATVTRNGTRTTSPSTPRSPPLGTLLPQWGEPCHPLADTCVELQAEGKDGRRRTLRYLSGRIVSGSRALASCKGILIRGRHTCFTHLCVFCIPILWKEFSLLFLRDFFSTQFLISARKWFYFTTEKIFAFWKQALMSSCSHNYQNHFFLFFFCCSSTLRMHNT